MPCTTASPRCAQLVNRVTEMLFDRTAAERNPKRRSQSNEHAERTIREVSGRVRTFVLPAYQRSYHSADPQEIYPFGEQRDVQNLDAIT